MRLRTLLFLFLSAAASAQAPLSQRVVHYQIDAKYDAKRHTIDAHEVLTYTNLTGQPQQKFPFHLYLNAFDPKSTFAREAHLSSPDFEAKPEYNGGIEIKSLTVAGMGAVTKRFVSPDDGNPDDKTVMEVELNKPVAPGAQVQFVFDFHDKLPEVVARTGYSHDFVLAGQWFPKVGVWWHGAWNCHQFHDTTEFFADFGTYDVKLTLPQNEVVGATGEQVGEVKNADGTKTLTFHQDDVHDFAWTADPYFQVMSDTFTGSGGTVHIRILMLPEHMDSAPRHMEATKGALQKFDEWYGPYPYKTLTVVDPESIRAGGMEYPTFITADTFWGVPGGLKAPELVIVHEFGHQYWYGMVATNEFEDAWLDEGINSYTEVKVMDALYGEDRSVLNTRMGRFSEHEYMRFEYTGMPDFDPIDQFAYHYVNFGSYGDITYGKTASVLLTLEGLIGEDTMRRALHTYFMRYRFTHPTKEDFLKTVEEVSGRDLRWYFDQAIYGTQVLDYEVWRANSDPADWWKGPMLSSTGEKDLYDTEVVLHRKGDFIFPVEVMIKFSDGSSQREQWDGKARWVRYKYQKRAKVTSVEIDPDHKIWLDRDLFNNSWRAKPDDRASMKLARYWTWATQFLAQCLAWLA